MSGPEGSDGSHIGCLFVVSAASGTGKSTLCRSLVEGDARLHYIVSHTTRKPRSGEVDGLHYTFLTEAEFRRMIEAGEFAEWAEVHGNLYGTSAARIRSVLEGGGDVLMDIDVQGASQIRRRTDLRPVLIFVVPPSMEQLEKRLRGRGTDAEDVIRRRLNKARDEIACYRDYDYLLVNDDFDRCVEDARAVIASVRNQIGRTDDRWLRKAFSLDA